MRTATLSAKFQISVSKEVRGALGLVPGKKLALMHTGCGMRLNPQPAVVDPTLAQCGLRRWALRERGEDAADRVIAAARNAQVVALDETTAVQAAASVQQFRPAGADALTDASALRHQALRVTCDAHLAGVAGVACQPKAAHAAQGRR